MTTDPAPRILVVEDDPPLLGMAVGILKRAGYDTVRAASAEEARTAVPDLGAIDCLFSDIVLPGASGLELAQQLTSERADLPVLFTTGQTDTGRHAEIRSTGHPLLLKPYTADTLCEALTAVLGGGAGGAGARP